MSVNNSKRVDFPIVGSFNEDPVGKVNDQRTINFYEVFDYEGKKPKYLAPWPGLKALYTASEGANGRAAATIQGFAYFAIRSDIYRLDPTLTFTRITDNANLFATTEGHVGIASNERYVAFVDGQRLLFWDTVTEVMTDLTFRLVGIPPLDITYMDGYFILVSGDPNNDNAFYVSDLSWDGTTNWNINAFARVNSRPTTLSVVSVLKRRIFLFGENHSEIWLDAGQADFPFRRDNNLLLGHGIKAKSSLASYDGEEFSGLFYLSNSLNGVGSVMMVVGTMPKKISTREIDEAIQVMPTPEDATGFAFKINGQVFYQINFTGGNRTFVFNATNNRWHSLEDIRGNRHIANVHAFYLGKHYIAGHEEDLVYEFSDNFFDINRDIASLPIEKIKRTRISRVMSVPTYNKIRIDRFQVDMLQGVGLQNIPSSDPAYDPVVFLSISEDGGSTYVAFERKEIGKSGKRLTRTIWRKLGARRDAIIKLEMFNRVPYYIFGAAIDVEVLPE
jgi:hypothetical protein